MLPNAALRDTRLSFKARGLYAFLASHEDGWATSVKAIYTEQEVDKKFAVESAVAELEKYGYLSRFQPRSADGTMLPGEWRVHHEPLSDEPSSGNPPGGVVGNPPHKKTNQEDTASQSSFLSPEEVPASKKKKRAAKKNPDGYDELRATVLRVHDKPAKLNAKENALIANVVKSLLEVDATPQQYEAVVRSMRSKWGPNYVTPNSVAKHWSEFAKSTSNVDATRNYYNRLEQ